MTTGVAKVDERGRLVLPATVRRALSLHNKGGDVVLTLEDGGALRLVSQQAVLRQAQALVRSRSQGRLLSDQLNAERRTAAASE